MNKVLILPSAGAFVLAGIMAASQADPESKANGKAAASKSKEALSQFNPLIGGWRGVGQPRRGSSSGSWAETAEWVWDFSRPEPAIRVNVSQGKIIKTLRLTFDEKSGLYRATADLAAGGSRSYEGKLDDDRLILETKPDAKTEIHRLTVTRLNEKRTVLLFEKGRASARSLGRVAEVGYTREGTRLAVEGRDGPECIVTGGKGTIQVSYKGQTYYLCCSGCKQAFDENPEKVLAEYRRRVEERNKATK